MKTIIFYVRKGARRVATAPGSAVTMRTLSQMALRGDGRVYIVDAPTAEHGRRVSMNCGNSAGTIEYPARPRISAPQIAATIAGEGRTGVKLWEAKMRHFGLCAFNMMRDLNPGERSGGAGARMKNRA